MGKAARKRILGEGYDKPKEGPNALQLKKERQKHNKKVDEMLSNKDFWKNLGIAVMPDGSLIESKPT